MEPGTRIEPLYLDKLSVQSDDVGFCLFTDFFRKRLKPTFLTARPCVGPSQGPARPYLLQSVTAVTWDAFCQDTLDILDRRGNSAATTACAILLLTFLPQWLVPNLRQHPLSSEFLQTLVWYLIYLVFLLLMLLSRLWMIARQSRKELQMLRNHYAPEFYQAGMELFYVQDGQAAYWIFRPLLDGMSHHHQVV